MSVFFKSCLILLLFLLQISNFKADAFANNTSNQACDEILNPLVLNKNKAATMDALNLEVIGQEDAVSELATLVERVRIGLNDPKTPIGVIMLPGPTRTGKTELFKSFVRYLGGKASDLIVIPGNELMDKGNTSKIVGAAPGNIGYGEVVKLSPQNLKLKTVRLIRVDGTAIDVNYVLLDEGEKAHPEIWYLLMRAFAEGVLTLSTNVDADFTKTFFVITSNIGQEEVLAEIEKARAKFEGDQKDFDETGRSDPELKEKIKEVTLEAIKAAFPREIVNRLSAIIQFYHLTPAHKLKISHKMISDIQNRLLFNTIFPVGIQVTDIAKKQMIQDGTRFENGVGDLQKVINQQVLSPLADMMAAEHVQSGDLIRLDYHEQDKKYTWTRISKGNTKEQLIDFAKNEYRDYFKEPVVKTPDQEKQEAAKTQVREPLLLEGNQYYSDLYSIYKRIDMTEIKRNVGSPQGSVDVYTSKYVKLIQGDQSAYGEICHSIKNDTYSLRAVASLPFQLQPYYQSMGTLSQVIISEVNGKININYEP